MMTPWCHRDDRDSAPRTGRRRRNVAWSLSWSPAADDDGRTATRPQAEPAATHCQSQGTIKDAVSLGWSGEDIEMEKSVSYPAPGSAI